MTAIGTIKREEENCKILSLIFSERSKNILPSGNRNKYYKKRNMQGIKINPWKLKIDRRLEKFKMTFGDKVKEAMRQQNKNTLK